MAASSFLSCAVGWCESNTNKQSHSTLSNSQWYIKHKHVPIPSYYQTAVLHNYLVSILDLAGCFVSSHITVEIRFKENTASVKTNVEVLNSQIMTRRVVGHKGPIGWGPSTTFWSYLRKQFNCHILIQLVCWTFSIGHILLKDWALLFDALAFTIQFL